MLCEFFLRSNIMTAKLFRESFPWLCLAASVQDAAAGACRVVALALEPAAEDTPVLVGGALCRVRAPAAVRDAPAAVSAGQVRRAAHVSGAPPHVLVFGAAAGSGGHRGWELTRRVRDVHHLVRTYILPLTDSALSLKRRYTCEVVVDSQEEYQAGNLL